MVHPAMGVPGRSVLAGASASLLGVSRNLLGAFRALDAPWSFPGASGDRPPEDSWELFGSHRKIPGASAFPVEPPGSVLGACRESLGTSREILGASREPTGAYQGPTGASVSVLEASREGLQVGVCVCVRVCVCTSYIYISSCVSSGGLGKS